MKGGGSWIFGHTRIGTLPDVGAKSGLPPLADTRCEWFWLKSDKITHGKMVFNERPLTNKQRWLTGHQDSAVAESCHNDGFSK